MKFSLLFFFFSSSIIASAPDSPHAAHYRKIAAGVLDALDVGKADAPQIIFE